MATTLAGSNALILEILNRNNYENWTPRVKTYLLAEDLWEAVEAIVEPPKLKDDEANYKSWTKKNAKALYAIQNSCGPEMFCFIREIETAKNAWEVLAQECKVGQGYDENNADHLERHQLFIKDVVRGDWDVAIKCLGEIDVRSVLAVPQYEGRGEIALYFAAREGHVHIVKELMHLMTQDDLKTKTYSGHTALHIAAHRGHVHVVKELPVQWMGEVKDKDGDTALHIAVHAGKVDVVKELVMLMREEDLKIKNDAGYSALHLAVNKGDMPLVKEFVVAKRKGENNIFEDNRKRQMHLPFAGCLLNGDWDQADACLRQLDNPCSAVTEVFAGQGLTALHVAAEQGHLDLTKGLLLLLKTREECLELKTTEDFTVFGSGITNNLGPVSEEFLMGRAKYMVDQCDTTLGSILEMQKARGYTALHIAVEEGNVDIAKELAPLMTQEGLEMQNSYGCTALRIAVKQGNVDIVKELAPLMRQEGLEVRDINGYTALHYAASMGNVDIVKELASLMRQEGLEIKLPHGDGRTALHIAVRKGNMDIVKELMPSMRVQALEKKDDYGYSIFAWAIFKLKDGDVRETAKYIAEKNSKIFGIPGTPDDEIPVVWAFRCNQWNLARYIYSLTPLELIDAHNARLFISHCFQTRKHIDLAWDLLLRYPNFAVHVDERFNTSAMLKLSEMKYAFLSGVQLTAWQRWIYKRIDIGEVAPVNIHDISLSIVPSEDDHKNQRDFLSSVINLLRRFAETLRKLYGINTIYKKKRTHKLIFKILQCMAEATKHDLSQDQLGMIKASFLKAIQRGHFELVTHICKENPQLLNRLHEDRSVKGIFHFAIESRQKEVYSLLYELEEEKIHDFGFCVVNNASVLHYAANLSSLPEFEHIQDAGLQMQRELQWFQEVESVVPSETCEYRDSNDMTARELFTKNHKKLMEDAEISIKGTATSCTVVGALIVTMMFAAAFTIPGGNDGNTGRPLFQDRKLFKVYIISDTISLVSSTSSVITFLGILTSRYAENDFLKSLPTKIMIGLITLFSSIVSMMIAYSCALILLFDVEAWIVTLSILFTSVPIILFLWLLFPFLFKTLMSTYGPGIVDKKKKNITN